MSLLESDEIKIRILKSLKKENHDISLNGLRKRIGAVNFNSVKRNCELLEKFGLVKIEQKLLENRKYNFISITQKGLTTLEDMKNATAKPK